MRFNRHNVQRAIWNTTETVRLGALLGVPARRLRELQSQFPGDKGRQVKGCVNYLMDHDPLASWRRVIVSLDGSGEREAAEKIRHLAEPITGEGRDCVCVLTVINPRRACAARVTVIGLDVCLPNLFWHCRLQGSTAPWEAQVLGGRVCCPALLQTIAHRCC
jgi:hypothetical protein